MPSVEPHVLKPGRRREVIRLMVAGRRSFRPGVTLTEVSVLLLALISFVLTVVGAVYLLKKPFG